VDQFFVLGITIVVLLHLWLSTEKRWGNSGTTLHGELD